MQIVAKTCGILDCDVCSMMNSVHGIKPFQLLWYNSHPYNAPIYQQIESVLIPWSLGKQSFKLWNLVQSSCRPISAITLFNTEIKVGKLSYWYFSSKSISKPLIWKIIWKCVYCQIILWQGSTSSGQWLFYYRVAKRGAKFYCIAQNQYKLYWRSVWSKNNFWSEPSLLYTL